MKKMFKMRILSFLTILAFISSAFIPFFAVYDIQSVIAAEKSDNSSYAGKKILICTADGFKWVAFDALQNEDNNHPSSNKKHYECPLCYVSAHGLKDFLSVSNSIFVHELITTKSLYGEYNKSPFMSQPSLAGYLSRAPPYTA